MAVDLPLRFAACCLKVVDLAGAHRNSLLLYGAFEVIA
jgi:hypothetical protein